MRLLLSVLLFASLSACGTTRLPLAYAPPSSVAARGPAVVDTVSALDQRGESAPDANWIGAIRGGFGNSLKRLETDRPLTEVVADATRDALRARGMLGGSGAPYDLRVAIEQFESDQVARREAKVRLRLAWIRRAGGATAFANQGQADIVSGSAITFEAGVFGSVEALRAIAAQAMGQALDQALDDPALTAFLASPR